MVTLAETPHDEAPSFTDRVEQAGRTLIAGHPAGAVRRIALYLVAVICLGATATFATPLGALVSVGGLVAILLLAITDQVA